MEAKQQFVEMFHNGKAIIFALLSLLSFFNNVEYFFLLSETVFVSKFLRFLLYCYFVITVFSLLNALGVYIFFLILGWASIGEGP